jgi:hypothetical protein
MHRVEKPFRAGPPTPRSPPSSVSGFCPTHGDKFKVYRGWGANPHCTACEGDPGTYHGVVVPDPDIAERDAACDAWVAVFHGACSAASKMAAKTAFCAGWSSHRNHVENNSPEPVDLRCAACKSDD